MRRALLAFATFLLVPAALAREPASSPGDHRGPPPRLSEVLSDNADTIGLDADTLAALEDLIAAQEPAIEALHDQARAAREAGDDTTARAAFQQANQAQHALMDQVEAQLTEDQDQALHELLPPPPREGGCPPGEGRQGGR